MTANLHDRLLDALTRVTDDAIELRHQLHQFPDLSGEEAGTRDIVLAALPAGTPESIAGTGALLRIGGPGPAVGIRGELDALPVQERSDVPWASARPGIMHACGHDIHLAAVVALSRAVAATPDAPPVVVVLQPREESYPSGARDIVEASALASHDIGAMVGAHVLPSIPTGTIACTPGAVNAAADEFQIVVRGRGGHAAYPHHTQDPVLALASIIVTLQQVVARNSDPMNSAVVSVCVLAAGDAANVTPDVSEARGTIRAMSEQHRRALHRRMAEVAQSVAAAHECTAEVIVTAGEPVLVNDAAMASRASRYLSDRGYGVDSDLRSYGADDFSYFASHIPSLMMFVGTDGGGVGLHHAEFTPADSAVSDVACTLLAGYLAAAHECGALTYRALHGNPKTVSPG